LADHYQQFMAAARKRQAEALKLHQGGKTYEQIGSELGVSKQRAYDIVQRAKQRAAAADAR
jgi:transposase